MDKIILKEYFLKYWKWGVIILLAILLFNQCNRSTELIADAKKSKENAKEYLVKARLAQSNLQGITAKYETKIDSVVKIEQMYKLQLSQNSKTTEAKLSDIKHYSTTDNTNYFKDRYNDTANVIQVENGTTLKDTISKKVISDLVVGDGAKAEVKILRNVVKTKDDKFELCNTTVDSLKLGIETISKNYEDANSEKDKALSDTEKAFKRERRKKNAWKVITGGILVGAGYFLIVK